MTRSSQCRGIVPVLAFAALVGFSATYAQELEVKPLARPFQDEDSALEITDKQYNEETGELLLVLRNRSDLTVTAFAVSLVSADPTGSGPTRVQGKDMFPGDGIAPGASYEMKVALGASGQSSSRFSARAVRLDHEIRSDNTSYGNRASIDRVFELRAAYFVELKEALTRLRQGTSGLKRSALPLLREETELGKESRRALTDPQDRHTQRDRSRLAAVASIGDLTEQIVRRIEAGESAEQAVADLELFLENELARASRNIRRVDLERYER
ncbi:MAG: hypothetical protein GY722_20050 [bacterium]|nr:hypothetical protein [bacterium]